jgi:hypothetical protein
VRIRVWLILLSWTRQATEILLNRNSHYTIPGGDPYLVRHGPSVDRIGWHVNSNRPIRQLSANITVAGAFPNPVPQAAPDAEMRRFFHDAAVVQYCNLGAREPEA